MGTVYLDSTVVGTFSPDTEGTSGDVYLDSDDKGDFTLAASGYVYLDLTIIGYYTAVAEEEEEGVGVGPTNLIYLEKLYEIRVYVSGGINWNYTRFGLLDAEWVETNPWIKIPIPGGTPLRPHMFPRTAESGVLRCRDDKAVYTLFRSTDVQSLSGNQYLIASTSYAAVKVVLVFKGTNVTVATGVEAEDTVRYTFTNFRIEDARSGIDENNEHVWEIHFNADSVERSEP